MLIKLEYSVTFPSTGRSFSETVNFQKGYGTITGSNEAGKSLLLEMVRWLLFGSAALRGRADDYKTLRGELTFAPRGDVHKVTRTSSNAVLWKGDKEIAVGTKAVNAKIAQLLGFGLEVFDVANVANQGDLERLGAMRPTERKRLVDSVIGLGVIEDLAKSANDESNQLARLADNLKSSLVEPKAPEKPEGYRPAAEIASELQELRKMKSELDQLTGWLASAARELEPTRPTCSVDVPASELQQMANRQGELRSRKTDLERQLSKMPQKSEYSDEDLDAMLVQWAKFHSYAEAQRFLSIHNRPIDFTVEQLDEIERLHGQYQAYLDYNRLESQVEKLQKSGKHVCPSCTHEWYASQADIDSMKARMEELARPGLHFSEPSPSLNRIRQLRAEISEREANRVAIETALAVPAAEQPKLTEADIRELKARNADAGKREAMVEELASIERQLEHQPNYHDMWMDRQRYEIAMETYQRDMVAYMERQGQIEQRKARVNYLTPIVEQLVTLDAAHAEATLYEMRLEEYKRLSMTYQEQMAKVSELETEAEDWKKAKNALTNLRTLVKQHLIPSLNKVASSLIVQMTGGQRRKIEVDDEFNILVDDQPISTLSGSGKAVANLALRLGLGQVLTHNVLSVFVGDEIDGSMDKDRAENTSRTLQTLKNRISQILLITHKYPSADYTISLGTTNEQQIS